MPALRSVVVLLLIPLACTRAAETRSDRAETRSYQIFHDAQQSIVAPLPGGGTAIAVSGARAGSVMVLDARGNVAAARRLGPRRPAFLTATAAGEIYLGSGEFEMRRDDRVTRLREDLSPVWTRRLVELDGTQLAIRSGAATRDGGVVLVGPYHAASFVAKLDAEGNVTWATVLDVSGDSEQLRAVRETADGFVAAGATGAGAWLVRLRRDGDLMWQRTYLPLRRFEALAVTGKGELVCVDDGASGPAVVKIGPDGEPLWGKITNDRGSGLAIVEAGAGLVAAISTGPAELALVALKNDGALLWQRRLQGEPIFLYDRDTSVLAVRRDRLAFTMAFNTPRVPVLDVDPATGSSDCGWLANGALVLRDVPQFRAEKLTVEVSAPGMVTQPAELGLTPRAIEAVAESCPPNPTTPAPVFTTKEVAFVSRTDHEDEKRYAGLLLARDVAGLEETATRLLRGGPSPDPMRPNRALYTFYGVMQSDAAVPEELGLAVMRQWVATYPRSSAARIALATALYGAAYKRRGSGYAPEVTATGRVEYEKLRNEVGKVLSSLGEAAHADPYYWRLHIAFADLIDGEDVRDVARRALKIHPDPEIAAAAVRFLQPHWGGSAEEVVAFAAETADLTREKYGDTVYALIAYELKSQHDPYPFDWPRVQKGFEDAIRLAPQWLPTYHRYAKLAWYGKDRAKARELFQRDELAWYRDAHLIWVDRVAYEVVRKWALEPAEPTAATAALP